MNVEARRLRTDARMGRQRLLAGKADGRPSASHTGLRRAGLVGATALLAVPGLVACGTARHPDQGPTVAPTRPSAAAPSTTPSSRLPTSPHGRVTLDAAHKTPFNELVLTKRNAVALWEGDSKTETEPDLTGNGHNGKYSGDAPTGDKYAHPLPRPNDTVVHGKTHPTVPNGYAKGRQMTVPTAPVFSVTDDQVVSVEMWVFRPDADFEFPSDTGYTEFGLCPEYNECNWTFRFYQQHNTEDNERANRFSAYIFNPRAGLGSAADEQLKEGVYKKGTWYQMAATFDPKGNYPGCPDGNKGTIKIWINGVPWNADEHNPTGCFIQYKIKPKMSHGPLIFGTISPTDNMWFGGQLADLFISNELFTDKTVAEDFEAMTGQKPEGECEDKCEVAAVAAR